MGRRQWHARLGLPLASMVALAGGLVVVLGGTPAGATTTTVTNTADDGTSSALRQVVTSAASGDTIVLTAGATYTLGDCTQGELRITGGKSLTFQSTSATQNAIIKQTCFDRVIVVEPSGTNETTTLRNITLTGGKKADGSGGAIKTNNSGGSLVLDGVEITGNAVANSPHEGGGIDAHGGLTVTNSTIANNCSESGGGGALVAHTGSAPISLTNSTVTGNRQPFNGAIDNVTDRSLSLTYVTLVGNTTNGGGACFIRPNSTATQAPPDPSDAENSTAAAGGVGAQTNTAVNLFINAGTLTSFGTVIGLPTGGPNCLVENATLVSKGYNFEQGGTDPTSCQLTGGPGDVQNGADPMLGALGANGGPTNTMLPLTGSPLIDAIPDPGGGCPAAPTITTDQRGLPRPSGPGCDIGALEVQVAAPAPVAVTVTPKFTG